MGIRVLAAEGTVAWRQAEAEVLRLGRPGEPERKVVAAVGLHPRAAASVACPHGTPDGLAGAWANLYREYAITVEVLAGRLEADWLDRICRVDGEQGARGVAFVEAAVASSAGDRFARIDA